MPTREKLPSSQPEKRRKPSGRSRWWGRIARWTALGTIWTALGLGLVVAWYAWDLPDVSELGAHVRRPSVLLTAADGNVIATYGDYYAGPAQVQDLPPYVMQAILATEDRRFFDHIGFDPVGIV